MFSQLLDLLFPPRCILCHRLLEKGERVFCSGCRSSLPILPEAEREQHLQGIEVCSSLFRYEGDIRSSLLRYKFHGLAFYGRHYAKLLVQHLSPDETACDVVTWVPLSRARLRKRGYDQAMLIARELAKEKGIPCEKLLIKMRNAAPQSGRKSREERRSNIHGAYRLKRRADVNGKKILLIDDIVTTGATLTECASVLSRSGAASVKAVTVARTDLLSE